MKRSLKGKTLLWREANSLLLEEGNINNFDKFYLKNILSAYASFLQYGLNYTDKSLFPFFQPFPESDVMVYVRSPERDKTCKLSP